MRIIHSTILGATWFLFSLNLMAQPAPDGPTYETGFNAATRIGTELYEALNTKVRARVHSRPVALETDVAPSVKTVEYPDDDQPLRLVFISVGFLDLMNNLSHAKAINRVQPGYFQKYLTSLANESGEFSLEDLPGLKDPRFWSDDVMNEQKSDFNQMVGMVIAIELSHHYLGHFKKYAAKLDQASETQPIPINNLLTPAEWEAALKAGARNALECGYGVDGLKALYDAIEAMPRRPAWTAYFLPSNVKVAKVKKDLDKAEKDYFQGK